MDEPAVVIDVFRGFLGEPLLRCVRLRDAAEIEVVGEPDADLPRVGTMVQTTSDGRKLAT